MRNLLIAVLFLTAPIAASADINFGWMGGFHSYKVEDPQGPTPTTTDMSWFNGVVTMDLEARDTRLFIHLYESDFELEDKPGSGEIGQEASRRGVSISYQRLFRVSRSWKPWFGIGGGYAMTTYKGRHTTAADGFLDRSFANRETSEFYITANSTTQWPIAPDWQMGVHLAYDHQLGEASPTTSAFVMFVYNWK